MPGDVRNWMRFAVRTDEGAPAVAEALRRRRRLASARVWPAAPGWVIVFTPDRQRFANGSLDLSRHMGAAVFQLGTADAPALSAITLGNVLYSDNGAACNDTDMLVTWVAPDRNISELHGKGPADLIRLLGLPAPSEIPSDALAVECTPKRWWEFWV